MLSVISLMPVTRVWMRSSIWLKVTASWSISSSRPVTGTRSVRLLPDMRRAVRVTFSTPASARRAMNQPITAARMNSTAMLATKVLWKASMMRVRSSMAWPRCTIRPGPRRAYTTRISWLRSGELTVANSGSPWSSMRLIASVATGMLRK